MDWQHSGRIQQTVIYLGKLFRMFIYQNDWKVLPMAAVIAAIVTYVVGGDLYKTMEGTTVGAFAISCVCIWNGFFNSIQVICRERAILKREHRAGLHISAYVFSHMVYQAFLCLAQSIIVVLVLRVADVQLPAASYVMGNAMVDLVFTLFLIAYAADMMALFISSFVRNPTTAMTFMPFIMIFQLIFSGQFFELHGIALTATEFTISKWGMNALCAVGEYNKLPNDSMYKAFMKMDIEETNEKIESAGSAAREEANEFMASGSETSAAQVQAAVTYGNAAQLSPDMIASGIQGAGIDPKDLQGLDPNALKTLDTGALKDLDPSVLGTLDTAALQGIDTGAVKDLDPNALKELGSINSDDLAALSQAAGTAALPAEITTVPATTAAPVVTTAAPVVTATTTAATTVAAATAATVPAASSEETSAEDTLSEVVEVTEEETEDTTAEETSAEETTTEEIVTSEETTEPPVTAPAEETAAAEETAEGGDAGIGGMSADTISAMLSGGDTDEDEIDRMLRMMKDYLSDDEGRDKFIKKCGALSYSAEFESSYDNIMSSWFTLIGYIILFPILSVIVLEFIDKDKR